MSNDRLLDTTNRDLGQDPAKINTSIPKPQGTYLVYCRQCSTSHSTQDVFYISVEQENSQEIMTFRCLNNKNDGSIILRSVLNKEWTENTFTQITNDGPGPTDTSDATDTSDVTN